MKGSVTHKLYFFFHFKNKFFLCQKLKQVFPIAEKLKKSLTDRYTAEENKRLEFEVCANLFYILFILKIMKLESWNLILTFSKSLKLIILNPLSLLFLDSVSHIWLLK